MKLSCVAFALCLSASGALRAGANFRKQQRLAAAVKEADPEVLCDTLSGEGAKYRGQREDLACPTVPGGLRDPSSPRGALVAAARRADQGRDLEMAAEVLKLVEAVEQENPTPNPLEAPELLSGCWRLVYTTSASILGTSRPLPFKPRPTILQSINAGTLKAMNEEWCLGGLLKNSVRADLTPRDDGRTVDVIFRRFGIGWLRIPAPKSAVGVLETTYLDNEMRVSRGDKGNIFVLLRDGETKI